MKPANQKWNHHMVFFLALLSPSQSHEVLPRCTHTDIDAGDIQPLQVHHGTMDQPRQQLNTFTSTVCNRLWHEATMDDNQTAGKDALIANTKKKLVSIKEKCRHIHVTLGSSKTATICDNDNLASLWRHWHRCMPYVKLCHATCCCYGSSQEVTHDVSNTTWFIIFILYIIITCLLPFWWRREGTWRILQRSKGDTHQALRCYLLWTHYLSPLFGESCIFHNGW